MSPSVTTHPLRLAHSVNIKLWATLAGSTRWTGRSDSFQSSPAAAIREPRTCMYVRKIYKICMDFSITFVKCSTFFDDSFGLALSNPSVMRRRVSDLEAFLVHAAPRLQVQPIKLHTVSVCPLYQSLPVDRFLFFCVTLDVCACTASTSYKTSVIYYRYRLITI